MIILKYLYGGNILDIGKLTTHGLSTIKIYSTSIRFRVSVNVYKWTLTKVYPLTRIRCVSQTYIFRFGTIKNKKRYYKNIVEDLKSLSTDLKLDCTVLDLSSLNDTRPITPNEIDTYVVADL